MQQSITTNPQFIFTSPRFFSAYAESIFPLVFFVDGRVANQELSMANAQGFFQNMKMPNDFYRANHPFGFNEISAEVDIIFKARPTQPGRNQGVGNYVLDSTSATLTELCLLYTNFVNETVRSMYPSPTGVLRDALKANLDNLFSSVKAKGCAQFFLYGK